MKTVGKIANIYPFLIEADWVPRLIVFYIFCALILFTFCLMLYIYKFPTYMSIVSVWIIKLLSIWLPLLITVLYFPVMGIISSIFDCNNNEDAINFTYKTDMNCFSDQHLVHVIIASIFSLVTLILCILLSLLFHEIKITDSDNTSRINSHYELCLLLFKTGLIFLNILITRFDIKWILWIYMIAGTTALCVTFNNKRHFTEPAQSIFKCFVLLNIWISSIFAYNYIFDESDNNDSISLYLIGDLLLMLVIFIKYNKDWERLKFEHSKITNPEDIMQNVFIYLELSMNSIQNKTVNILILKGYVVSHSKRCTNASCVLKQETEKYFKTIEDGSSIKVSTNKNLLKRNLLRHCAEIFIDGINRFPDNNMLRLLYSLYLFQIENRQNTALEQIGIAELENPNLEEQFFIYHFKELIKESL